MHLLRLNTVGSEGAAKDEFRFEVQNTIYGFIHSQCEPSLCLPHCYLISEPIETIHTPCDHIMWHYSEVT